MKASVPTPDNSARPSPKGRIFGLKRSTLSLITALTIGTPLLVACDNADSIPVNTEVTSTPVTTTTEQTTAPTTTSKAPVVESTTSKAPKPKPSSTKATTTSAKPANSSSATAEPSTSKAPTPTTPVEPEPIEPEVDFEAIQGAIDSYMNEAKGGVAKQELLNALTAGGYTPEDALAVVDDNNIDWLDEALQEANLLLNDLESPSRHSLREAFAADSNASLFTADEIEFTFDAIDWQPYASEAVQKLNEKHNPATPSILEQIADEALDGFYPEEISSGIEQIDWVSKDRQLVEEFFANEPGGQTDHEAMMWLESHGYSELEALSAVSNLEIDWNKQAELEAHYLLENADSASRTSLRHYFLADSEAWRFQPSEVDHAIEQIDWQPYATKEVQRLNSEYQPYARSELLNIISWELAGFTDEEIQTAVDTIDWNAKSNALVDSFLNDQSSGVSYSFTHDWLMQHGYTSDEAIVILDDLQIDWNQQAALVAHLYLADNPNASRTTLNDHFEGYFWPDLGFTDEEISYAIEQVEWQSYATKQINDLYSNYHPATKAQLLHLADYYLEGYTNKEIEFAADQYDWAAKELEIVESYRATVVGGQSKNQLIEWFSHHGYQYDEAVDATENLSIDWKEQAFLEIQTYEGLGSAWSGGEKGFRAQFDHSGKEYTPEEIDYAIEKLNVDWVAEGIVYVESLLNSSNSGYDKKFITNELQAGGLTDEEIESVYNGIEIDWNDKVLQNANSIIKHSQGISEAELSEKLPSLYVGFIGRDEVVYALENVSVDWNKQALKRGYSLLEHSYQDYSYYGVYDELTRSPISFTHEEAEYAQANLNVDWVARATKKLDSYLSWADFSKARATSQLIYTGYTPEQAEAAVASKADSVWRDNAVREARLHLRSNSPSRAELIDYLTTRYSTSFTQEEAEYAADQVGLTK